MYFFITSLICPLNMSVASSQSGSNDYVLALIKFPRRKAVARVSVVVGEARHPLSPDDFLCLVRHVNELDWIRRTRRGWTADGLAGPRCWGMGKQQLRSVSRSVLFLHLCSVLTRSTSLPPSFLPSMFYPHFGPLSIQPSRSRPPPIELVPQKYPEPETKEEEGEED